MLKACSKCKVEKPVDQFYANRGMKDGYTSACRTCTQASKHAPTPPPATMTVEIWKHDHWETETIVGQELALGCLYVSDGRFYSQCYWRKPGTKPYCGCIRTSKPLALSRGGVGLTQAKRSKYHAGPFTKKELWMAEKMVKENPTWNLVKKGTSWWLK